jgi:sialate O-acetylesterase
VGDHYRNKRDAGVRLALNALAKDYGRKLEWSGPLYESMKVESSAIRLRFSHADGLMAKGGGSLKRFLVAGDDLDFVPAEARIDDGGVVVSSAAVPHPVAVPNPVKPGEVHNIARQARPQQCQGKNAEAAQGDAKQ